MIGDLASAVCKAAGSDEIAILEHACSKMVREMNFNPSIIEASTALAVLKAIRKYRRFGVLRAMANAFLDDGCTTPMIRYYLAQALIETGETMPAIHILEPALADLPIGSKEWGEFKGALGRAWKDRAIKLRGRRDDFARHAVAESVRHYRDAWLQDKSAFTYQAINFVAVCHWDSGFAIDKEMRTEALGVAREIVSIIEARPEKDRDSWACATAGEAWLALGRIDEAITWYHQYVSNVDDPFDLASSARQLQVLWKADQNADSLRLIAPLLGKLGITAGGAFSISPASLESLAQIPRDRHEAVLGDIGARTFTWVQEGAKKAQAVAMIRKNGSPHGTGFVVRGADLRADLGDELFIMTNSHVISEPAEEGAACIEEATVTFELGGDGQRRRVERIIWQSPSVEHDVALLRVVPPIPATHAPLTFTHRLRPWANRNQARVLVIGHPQGQELHFSFEDNRLLDYDRAVYDDGSSAAPCRIHYRSPTAKGSSGSPIFDENWNVIGIHHAGGKLVPMLNGTHGVYDANEGLWIEGIRRAITKVYA